VLPFGLLLAFNLSAVNKVGTVYKVLLAHS